MADFAKTRSRAMFLALSVGMTLAAAGCSGTGGDDEISPTPTAMPDTPTPFPEFAGRVTILNLDYNQAVVLDQTKIYPVDFKVDNYTLAAKGNCGNNPNCGRVEAYVDTTKIGEGYASPVELDFNKFTGDVNGQHMITLKLVFDDGSQTGATSEQTVRITAPTPPDETPPTIVVTSPITGSLVRLGGDASKSLPVGFTVANITLAAPGECGGVEGNCGHVHLLIDGENGNSSDAPYNNAAITDETPADVYFSYLEDNGFDAYGTHEITAELHHDDHSPWENATTGLVISSAVTVRSVLNSDPWIELTLDPDTTSYNLGTDGLKSVPLSFNVENFTLTAPGTCDGAADCGHVHILIDGANGDDPEAPYNNAAITDATPADALFYWLEFNGFEPSGRHVVTFELHNDDHSAVVLYDDPATEEEDGINMAANGTILTQYADDYALPVITIQTPANNANVTLNDEGDTNVRFSVENFVPKAAGQCDSGTYCGKYCLQIDGAAGNKPGESCNVSGIESPLTADFSVFASPAGEHHITITLLKPDGTTLTNNSKTGTPVTILDAVNVVIRESTGGGGGGTKTAR